MPEFDWSQYTGNLPWLKERTIYLTRSGSHSYGTNIESSDLDYRGVAIAPLSCYLGVVDKFEQHESTGDRSGGNLHKTRQQTGKEPDLVVFEFRKFIKLASQANPNIVELLFTDLQDVDQASTTVWGWELREMRDLFVTKRARTTFAGYAHA